jgi:hypothetical protein
MTERMERKQYSECSSHESNDSLCRASTGGIEGYNYVRNVSFMHSEMFMQMQASG